jgi:hypothetical protein
MQRGDIRCVFALAQISADRNDEQNFQYYSDSYFESFFDEDGQIKYELEQSATLLSKYLENIFDSVGENICAYISICHGKGWECKRFLAMSVFKENAKTYANRLQTTPSGELAAQHICSFLESLP